MPDIAGKHINGWVIGGGLAVVGLGGYELYKHSVKASGQVSAAATGTTATGYGYGQTGYGYGQNYGYAGYGQYGSPYGYGGPYGLNYGYGRLYGYGSYGYKYNTNPATNAQWVQNAISLLAAQHFNRFNVSVALGLYIRGQAVTPHQEEIISAAVGVAGDPPVAGSNGFPPAVRTTGTGRHNPKEVTVPNVIGKPWETGSREIEHAGLKVRRTGYRGNASPRIVGENPEAGKRVRAHSTVILSVD